MLKLLSSSLAVFVVAGLCGCGKKAEPSAPTEQPRPARSGASVESDPAGAPPPPPPVTAPNAAATEPEPSAPPTGTENEGRDGFLKRVYSTDPQVAVKAMNQFIEGRSMTATTELTSFDQLVKEAGWPRPPKAPAGFRYVLDMKTRLVVVVQ